MSSYPYPNRGLLFLILSVVINGMNGQMLLLHPHERAIDLYDKYENLSLLGHWKHCANPAKMFDPHVEALLSKGPLLTEDEIVDALSIYNRWVKNDGYRCIPSKFECKQVPNAQNNMWRCQCPTLGDQVITEVRDVFSGSVTGCRHVAGTFGSPGQDWMTGEDSYWTPGDECSKVEPEFKPTLPEGYKNEVVCAKYFYKEIVNNVERTQLIDTGLHFETLQCPGGQQCEFQEFPGVLCNQFNLDILLSWMDFPRKNDILGGLGKYKRLNRMMTWPPCICASNTEVGFPTEDPLQDLIHKCLRDLPQTQHEQDCDRTRLGNMENCINGNWYILTKNPGGPYEKFMEMCAFYKKVGLECDQSKGLFCNQGVGNSGKCECIDTPRLPGWSPRKPDKHNKNGHCMLDKGSDCDPNKPFRCDDEEECLLAKFFVPCTEVNKLESDKFQPKRNYEIYQRRCACFPKHLRQNRFPDPNKNEDEEEESGTSRLLPVITLISQVSLFCSSYYYSTIWKLN